jgi:outer membrane protein OmpA-like peptidoglycan-associated protein
MSDYNSNRNSNYSSNSVNGALSAWNRLHQIVAAALAALLALLWVTGMATPQGTCPAAAPAAAPEVAAIAAAPVVEAPPIARLYFDVDVSDKIAEGQPLLDPVVAWLAANPTARAVVTGYHDPTGTAGRNHDLAKSRAQTVQAALVAAGVAADRIDLVKPVSTDGGGDLKEARRVEVSVK